MKKRRIAGKNSWGWVSNRRKVRGADRRIFISHNFSDVEDSVEAFEMIRNLSFNAGNNAAAEAKAAGIARVYIRNYKDLIKISPAGDEILIHPKIRKSSFYIKYKPFTVLHAVR